MATKAQDTFARANQAGWGTASDGQVWSIANGDGQSVANNEGLINSSSASTFATLGPVMNDTEDVVRVLLQDGTNTAGLLARFTDTNNYYLFRYDGNNGLAFFKNTGGTKTTVHTIAFTPDAATYYWLKFHVQGTTIEFKHWTDGSAEPGTWDYSTTDADHASGKAGLYGFSNGSDDRFDHFLADDLINGSTYQGQMAATGGGVSALSAQVVSGVAMQAQGGGTSALDAVRVQQGQMAASGGGSSSLIPHTPGGLSTLSVIVQSKSWTLTPGSPSNGTDILSKDQNGDGWWVGLIPGYGGDPVSSWGDIVGGVQQTDQASRKTTISGGHIHLVEQDSGGTFEGSEGDTGGGAFALTELEAAQGGDFRRYYQGVFTDGLGVQWTCTICVWPGEPGFVAFHFQGTPGAAISLSSSDSLEFAAIASLQQDDATWNPANGGYGIVGGAHGAWPGDGSGNQTTAVEPDYFYITPQSPLGSSRGIVTVKGEKVANYTPSWPSAALTYLDNTSRLKVKLQTDINGTWGAGVTWDAHFLRAVSTTLDQAEAEAIAADYLNPTAPTMTVGAFSGFDKARRLWTVAASANQAALTLDASVKRFTPAFEFTGWTDGTYAPKVQWGGAPLADGTDYRWKYDAGSQTMQVRLADGVVASGAVTGQRNNAELSVASPMTQAAMAASGGGTSNLVVVRLTPALCVASGGGSSALQVVRVQSATLPASGSGLAVVTAQAIYQGQLQASGSGSSQLLMANTQQGQMVASGGGSSALSGLRAAPSGAAASGSGASALSALRLVKAQGAASGGGLSALVASALRQAAMAASGGGSSLLNPNQFSPSGLPPTATVILLTPPTADALLTTPETADAVLK